ncbi:hypothetical protein CcaCcLH18_14367 [Colletotrichum camelliae]|nr:hypothetical protein CcaCcLH18_14367 [Colletotrichum camelliae]
MSVESGPTQDESNSDMEGDSDGDGNIDSSTSPVRGIPTLQYANLMFAKNRQGQGLTSKAALQALARSRDLREVVLKYIVLGQRIRAARTHDEVNGMPYFPRLERLEIKPADAAAIEEVGRISNLTYLHVDASCSRHAGARILSHSLRDLVHLRTLKITNGNGTAPDEEQWDTRSVMTLIQEMDCLQHLQLDVGDDVLETSEGLLRKVCYGRPSLETLAMGFSACLPTKAGGPQVVLGLGRPRLRTLALGNVITREGRIAGAEEVAFMAEGLWEIFPEMESLTVPCAGTVAVGGGSRE